MRALGLACSGLLLAALAPVPGAAAAPSPAATAGVQHSDQGLRTWWYDAMKLAQAHRQTTGEGVRIAVIDEGIDPNAPELRGANVTLARDCDGNKVKKATGAKADHGTAVTTLISGTGRGANGAPGIRGIAPGADVRFYATDSEPSDATVNCTTDIFTAKLMELAIKDHPDIITTSLGLGYTDPMRAALQKALDRNIVVIGATGDRTRPSYVHLPMEFPAARQGVVAVNAADKNGRTWVNNPPPALHTFVTAYPTITAPGVDVTGVAYVPGRGWTSGYDRTGTSDAAPLVAGALALVKSKYPDATGNQLIQNLVHWPSSRPKFAWDRAYGFGLVSVTNMLAHDPTKWPDVNPLLHGPKRAVKDFPASVYGAQPAATTEPAASASAGGTTDPADGKGDGTQQAAASTDGGGLPGWTWALLAAVVAGAVGAGIALNKRGSRPATADRNGEEA